MMKDSIMVIEHRPELFDVLELVVLVDQASKRVETPAATHGIMDVPLSKDDDNLS
jgi:hypothetical protein